MTSLMQQSRRARDGLDQVRLANLTREELQVLQNRKRDWDQRRKAKETADRQFSAMSLVVAQIHGLSEQYAQTQSLAAEARSRLQASADLQVLTEGHLWTRLLSLADSTNQTVAGAAREAWEAYLQSLPQLEPPGILELRVPRTPSNTQALMHYRTLHAEFVSLTRSVPAAATRLVELEACADKIQEILSSLTVDAPDEIRTFLRAAEATGARLELLTPTVLDWLREHDNIQRFVVRTSGAVWS